MDLTLSKELARIPDLRHQVRSLHRFRSSFNRGIGLVARHMNMVADIDESRSTLAFLNWAEKADQDKPYGAHNSPDSCLFTCGLLLAELIRTAPVTLVKGTHRAVDTTLPLGTRAIAEFWPEGFLLTSYCASLLDAILQQDFKTSVTLTPVATDIRTWWSFRENALDDPSAAIGFFDLFAGQEPNWPQMEAASLRHAIRSEPQHALQ